MSCMKPLKTNIFWPPQTFFYISGIYTFQYLDYWLINVHFTPSAWIITFLFYIFSIVYILLLEYKKNINIFKNIKISDFFLKLLQFPKYLFLLKIVTYFLLLNDPVGQWNKMIFSCLLLTAAIPETQ